MIGTMHGHQLQRRLAALKPLPSLKYELRESLAVEPGAVGTADIAATDCTVLVVDLGVTAGGLWVVENDIARLTPNRRDWRTDVPCFGGTIDVLDLENVVVAHSFLRGERRESRNGNKPAQGLVACGCMTHREARLDDAPVQPSTPLTEGSRWGRNAELTDEHGAGCV